MPNFGTITLVEAEYAPDQDVLAAADLYPFAGLDGGIAVTVPASQLQRCVVALDGDRADDVAGNDHRNMELTV